MHGNTAADRISWGDSDEESISDLENEAVRREATSYRESEEGHALIMQGALAAGRRMMAKEAFDSLEKMKVEDLPTESKGRSRCLLHSRTVRPTQLFDILAQHFDSVNLRAWKQFAVDWGCFVPNFLILGHLLLKPYIFLF